MTPYHILMPPEAYAKAEAYRIKLASTSTKLTGVYLQQELQGQTP